MKKILLCLLMVSAFSLLRLQAQDSSTAREYLFRIYEDNDFINFYMRGTDKAYTNGTSLALFYDNKKDDRSVLDRWMPKAGNQSHNIYGWSIAQIMFTPNDISTPKYQPDDYPYSGALFVTHSLYSYDEEKKLDLQTEAIVGVSGPAALTRQTQTIVHKMLDYQQPMGWDNQRGNRLLANLNLTAEKQLLGLRKWLELLGSVRVAAGNLMNTVSVATELRVGKMNPYFSGLIRQYCGGNKKAQRFQVYFFARPEGDFVLSNETVQARSLSGMSAKDVDDAGPENRSNHSLNHWLCSVAYGAVVSTGQFALSVSQSANTAQLKGLYAHQVGNISLYYGW